MPVSPANRGTDILRATIFGAPEDIAEADRVDKIGFRSVPGLAVEPGAIAWWPVYHNDKLVVPVLNAKRDFVTGSFIDMTVNVYDPATNAWDTIVVETDLGFTGVLGFTQPFGSGPAADACVAGGRVVITVPLDYRNWEIAVWGRYPSWLVLNAAMDDIDYTKSLTADELKALVAVGDPDESFPDATNSFNETYANNRGLNECDVFPNGWVIVDQYFLNAGVLSGALQVFDADGVQRGFYRLPDMTLTNAEAVTVSPRDIVADPSSTDPEDMRFTMCVDATVISDSSRPPFWLQEFSFNATTGAIAPVCAPIFMAVEDEDPTTMDDYLGNAVMAHIDQEGTVWVGTSVKQTFTARALCAFVKTAGERKWAAEAPPTAGWEDDLGGVWITPDFQFDFRGTGLPAAFLQDSYSRRIALVGASGIVRAFVPDDPLVARPNLNPNDFSANVTGWTGLPGSSTIAWDAGDGGRLKQTTAGGGSQSLIQLGTDFTTGVRINPVDIGQSMFGWIRYKANSTLRRVRCEINFYDAHGNGVAGGVTNGGAIWEKAGEYVYAQVAKKIPFGATQVKIFGRVLDATQPAGEIHYVDSAYVGVAPATFTDDLTLSISGLPLGDVATSRWMTKGTMGRAGEGWVCVSQYPPASATMPAPMPQYLVKLKMREYRPYTSDRHRGPTNPLRKVAV